MSDGETLEKRIAALDPQERYHLEQLKERMSGGAVTPKSVGEVLPEAVLLGEGDQRRLSKTMVEITERAIDNSVSKDPETLSAALFPIIGSAVRKAFNKFLSDSMSYMNDGLEKAFSAKRLGWRWKSLRTGIPFIEIVLRETLQFRVEHVFLIHRRSGLLLRSVSLPGIKTADDDMVASMLTAVRSYVKDSLSLRKADAVDRIAAGEYVFVTEDGPRATIAAIVRGSPDGGVRGSMQEALESIHLRFSPELERFSGDTETMEAADDYLRPCLTVRKKDERKKFPVYSAVILAVAAAAAVCLAVSGSLERARENRFLAALNESPGIMVANVRRTFGRTEVKLLRDPRASSPEFIARDYPVDLSRFRFDTEPFVSPLLGGESQAPARAVPDELSNLARRLGSYVLLFEQDSGELRAGQEQSVREAGSLIAEIVEKAKRSGFEASVEITGHSAGTAQDEAGIAVSEERAAKAMALFASINAPLVKFVRTRGVGVSEPLSKEETTETDRERNRSVTFKAIFR